MAKRLSGGRGFQFREEKSGYWVIILSIDVYPDITIVLTETWLSKEHLENEILPDSIYKIYRKDKSKRSYPRILITQISFEGRGVESLLQSRLASVLKMTRLMSALGLK